MKSNNSFYSDKLMLVTGAAGFIGSHLVEHLLRSCGARLRVLVRSKKQAEKFQALGVEVALGDLSQPSSLGSCLEGVWGVFHIAAAYRQAAVADDYYFRVNAEGTRVLLEEALRQGVKRFIYCSTCGVLGDLAEPPGDEHTPYAPCDIYQESKVAGEKIALEYFRSGKIPGVVIRPAMVYGPGDRRMLKLFRLIARRRFFFVGRGDKMTHFIDVRDLVRAFCLAMEREHLNARIYIIAGSTPVPLKEMTRLIAAHYRVKPPSLHLPAGPILAIADICEKICVPLGIEPLIFRRRVEFYLKNRYYDTSAATRELGFSPEKSLVEEVAEIAEWYRREGWVSVGVTVQILADHERKC